MSDLIKHAAEIILLRYKEAGIFDQNYDKEPLPVEYEIAEEIIRLVRADERERCVQIIDEAPEWMWLQESRELIIEAIKANTPEGE